MLLCLVNPLLHPSTHCVRGVVDFCHVLYLCYDADQIRYETVLLTYIYIYIFNRVAFIPCMIVLFVPCVDERCENCGKSSRLCKVGQMFNVRFCGYVYIYIFILYTLYILIYIYIHMHMQILSC